MLNPVMNNTKWNELRLAMYALKPAPKWSTLSTEGHEYGPDGEWFYHFRNGGYEDIAHVDIHTETPAQRESVRVALQRIHVPGEETAKGFRVFGYIRDGEGVDYL